jgi:hypothetical protein
MMFDALEAVSYFGRPIRDDELAKWMAAFGVDLARDVVLEEGMYSSSVELFNEGVELTFTDEAMYLGKEEMAIGEGTLYFSGVFLHAEGHDGYRQFQGAIPGNIQFGDLRADLMDKLGTPGFSRKNDGGIVVSERWDRADHSIAVSYLSAGGSLKMISIFRQRKSSN